MSFVTPFLAVAGVAAVAVPIVIFLLWRQRRTPIKWAAMRFLIEAYRKHRRRLQVEQLLLLAVRCLIVALLGLALARPLLEGSALPGAGGGRVVYLVIDDGLVSSARSSSGSSSDSTPASTSLGANLEVAARIIEGLEPGDRVGVITAARPAQALLSPPSTDHAAVAALVAGLTARATPTDLGGALDRLRAALAEVGEEHDQVFVYLLSELRAGSAAFEDALPRSLPPALEERDDRVVLLAAPPASEPISNVQITSVEPARRIVLAGALDGSGQVTVRLARQGGELAQEVTRVRLEGDAVTHLEPKIVTWGPGETEASVDFILDIASPGEREVGLTAAIDDDALAMDNTRHTVLDLRRQIRVVLLDRPSFGAEPSLERLAAGQWIRLAVAPVEGGPVEAMLVEPAALDLADLRAADAVFMPRPDLITNGGWDVVRRFVDKGGLLIVSPPAELRVHQWSDQLRERLGLRWSLGREVRDYAEAQPLAVEQPDSTLLRMVSSDLAELCRPVVVNRVLPVNETQFQGAVVLRLADGAPLVLAGAPADAPPDDGAGGDAAVSRGLVVCLMSAPELEWTNLPVKPLMVPLLHEVLRQGLSLVRSSGAVEVGGAGPLLVGPAATALRTPDGGRVNVDRTGRPERALDHPGLYGVIDGAAQDIGAVAVNVDPRGARTGTQPESAARAWLQKSGPWSFYDLDDIDAALRGAEGGSPLAGLLLLAVVVLVLVETMLARWFSHAYSTGPVADPALGATLFDRRRSGARGEDA